MSTYLSIKEAAEIAGVSTKTIRRYVNSGVIVSKTVRGKRGLEYRVLKSSLLQHFRRLGYEQTPTPSESVEDGEVLVRLRHLVPRYLYDDARRDLEKTLLEKGRLATLLDQAEAALIDQAGAANEGIGKSEKAKKTVESEIITAKKRISVLERENGDLRQAMAEKDTLISLLEKQIRGHRKS